MSGDNKNQQEEATAIQKTVTRAVLMLSIRLYVLKALNSQDFELLRQTFPKPLTKYVNILESIIVRT